MTSPADAEAPAPAQRDADSGWGMKIAPGVVGFIVVVEFVLPGFAAAWFSRSSSGGTGVVSLNDFEFNCFDAAGLPAPPAHRAELTLLFPSICIMNQSQTMRRFYMWQYRIAGGRNIGIP
jgi:hypothetical protein